MLVVASATSFVAKSNSIVLPVVLKSAPKILYGIVTLALPVNLKTEYPSSSVTQPFEFQSNPLNVQEVIVPDVPSYTQVPGFASELLLPAGDRNKSKAVVSA